MWNWRFKCSKHSTFPLKVITKKRLFVCTETFRSSLYLSQKHWACRQSFTRLLQKSTQRKHAINRPSLFDCMTCFSMSFGIKSILNTTGTKVSTWATNKDASIFAISFLSNKKKTKHSSPVGSWWRGLEGELWYLPTTQFVDQDIF